MPLYGKIGDVHGRKRVLLFAIGLFVLGSVACGFAQSTTENAEGVEVEVRWEDMHRHTGHGRGRSRGGRTPDLDRITRRGERLHELKGVIGDAAGERRVLAGDDAPAPAGGDAAWVSRPGCRVEPRRVEHDGRGHARCSVYDCAFRCQARQWSAMDDSSTGSDASALTVSIDLRPRTMRESRARAWLARYQGSPRRGP